MICCSGGRIGGSFLLDMQRYRRGCGSCCDGETAWSRIEEPGQPIPVLQRSLSTHWTCRMVLAQAWPATAIPAFFQCTPSPARNSLRSPAI